ncbi:MAG TPA: hypothetical protein PKM88_11000 [bacterium]|nr:hypothetical protein [bacterium]
MTVRARRLQQVECFKHKERVAGDAVVRPLAYSDAADCGHISDRVMP